MQPTQTTLAKRQDESILGKLSVRTRQALEALAGSKLAQQARAEVEHESVSHRATLRAQLKRLDAEHPGLTAKADEACRPTLKRLEAAEEALRLARAAYNDAIVAGRSVEFTYLGTRGALVDELLAGADARLGEFVHHCENLDGVDVRVALLTWPDKRNWTGVQSNIVDTTKAHNELRAVIDEAAAAKLEPMTFDQVSKALIDWCERLAPTLAAIQTNPPSLVGEHVEVHAPRRWNGRTQFRTVDAPAPSEGGARVRELMTRANKEKA
jgi:hypothetical protein